MRPLEQVPAVRRIDTDRADLCALDVVGLLGSADLENAFGLIEAAHVGHGRIDLMIRLSGYEGLDWDGIHSAAALGGKRKALRHVGKCAILGGPAWISAGFGLAGLIAPMESRHFGEADEASAWEWLGARPLGE
jgi:hypothetical protein